MSQKPSALFSFLMITNLALGISSSQAQIPGINPDLPIPGVVKVKPGTPPAQPVPKPGKSGDRIIDRCDFQMPRPSLFDKAQSHVSAKATLSENLKGEYKIDIQPKTTLPVFENPVYHKTFGKDEAKWLGSGFPIPLKKAERISSLDWYQLENNEPGVYSISLGYLIFRDKDGKAVARFVRSLDSTKKPEVDHRLPCKD